MTLTSSLANALSGLNAAARMADVVSANLANAMTDGYGRRRADLSAASVGGTGAGVRVDGLSRMTDRGLVADRRLADAALGGDGARAVALARLEEILGKPDDPAALPARIAALEQALVAASTDPASEVRLAGVVNRFDGVVRALHEGAEGIRTLRQAADQSIATQVKTLNESLQQVERLNEDISDARARNLDALGLIDQRQVVIDRIAAIVPLRELERPGGTVALMTTSGAMLIDGPPVQFGFSAASYVAPEMTLASGGLSGLTRDGVDLGGIGNMGGGSLGAAFTLRDETLVAAQAGLDAVARDLVERFQDPAVDPTLAGGPGLLTDAGAAFDAANTVGLSARIAVNAAIDPARGGAHFRLRDGINAAAAGPVGDAGQIDGWLDALSDPRALHGGGGPFGAAQHAARFTSGIGALRLAGDENRSFAAARHATLREAELADGVDNDHEMQMLLRIEQAYAANARVIQAIDAMIKNLMEI